MSKKKLIASGGVLVALIAAAIAVYFIFFYIPYGAVMYDDAEDMLLESFIEENKIGVALYENPDYDPSVNDPMLDKYIKYDDMPTTRTYIIKDAETYAKIFKEGAIEVDFDREMLLIYTFTHTEGSKKYFIKNITVNERTAVVEYHLEYDFSDVAGSTEPGQRWFVVEMDKLDVDEVKFVEK